MPATTRSVGGGVSASSRAERPARVERPRPAAPRWVCFNASRSKDDELRRVTAAICPSIAACEAAVAEAAAKLVDEAACHGRASGIILKLGAGDLGAVAEGQHRILQPGIHQIAIEFVLVFQINLRLAALGAEQRRLRDIQITGLDQRTHMPEEEGQEKRSDVASVNVGIRHDNDFVVSRLLNIKLSRSNPRAKCRYQRAKFGR